MTKNYVQQSSPSLEEGTLSGIYSISNDENIPDNQQKMSVIKPLEATVQRTSCSNGHKQPEKRRLNLKSKAAASKITNPVSKCNNLEEINGNNGSKNDSMRCCPVCKYDFTSLDSDFKNVSSDAEINEHINKCLDGGKTGKMFNLMEHSCQLCGKDLTKYNTARRQQHINRCCDNIEKTKPKVQLETASIVCPICRKAFKTTKSRQTHMKKCAKENNVSTHRLVELNQQENTNNPIETTVTNTSEVSVPHQSRVNTLGLVRSNKRKRVVNLPNKNLDDDTQLALALSASIQCDNAGAKDLGKKKKKKNENSELPALLLRSDDEMKKVTEARAAAVLCQWVDNDEEIQCTPALAPSFLVKKYGKGFSSANLEILPEQIAEYDDITGRCNSPTIKVRGGSNSKRNEKCDCEESVVIHGEESKRYLTVDTENRLWCLSSLLPDIVANNGFYVPNLLPKSTPPKKKAIRSASSTKDKEQIDKSGAAAVHEDNEDCKEEPPSSVSSQTDGLTESQEKDIDMLVELLTDETPDTHTTKSEKDQQYELDKTWFPSSGFCVRKDPHEMEDKNKKDVDALLNDLSCMVGNPLLSDVEIVAKDEKKFCAHSFMLSARCSSLAEILHSSESRVKDDERNALIRIELLDIDVRAVRAVLTYIYTAYFIPVVDVNVLNDVKKLIYKWDLNCGADKWEVINDGKGRDNKENVEHDDNNVGDLDVLLESLWEGEEENISDKNLDENAFGDSFLDDQLGDMEIKIYTQAAPQTIPHESNANCAIVLDSHSEDRLSNVNDKVNEFISQSSDDINCIPESPSSFHSQRGEEGSVEGDHDHHTLVEQPLDDDVLETKTDHSSRPNHPSTKTSPQLHSSPIPQEFNGDELDHVNSSPISLHSPSSPVEMMSSPERSPLPDNLNDFDVEDESSNFGGAQKYSMQVSSNSPLFHSPYASPTKSISETMIAESCLDVAYISPETTSPLANSPTAEYNKRKEEYSESQTVTNPSRTKSEHCDDDEDDSLLDIFASFPDSTTEKSRLSISKQKINNDSCLDINLSLLSPEEVANNDRSRRDEGNIHQQVRQPPVCNSKYPSICKEKSRTCSITDEDFDKPTTKQTFTEKGQTETWFDDSSLKDLVMEKNEAGLQLDKIIAEKGDRCFTTFKNVFETPKRQLCNVTRRDESWMEHSLTIEESNTKVIRDTQEGDHFMTSMCVFETPIKQSTTGVVIDDSPLQLENEMCVVETPMKQSTTGVDIDDSPSQLENEMTSAAQNNEHVDDNDGDDNDGDEFIDYYDDGGFNCDIDDYFTYDTNSTIEKDDLIPANERPAVEDVNEKTNIEKCEKKCEKKVRRVNNNVQAEENKKDDRDKDMERGKNDMAEGKRKKPVNEVVCERTQGVYNQHQEDPGTPMHDYSNMATPELKVELKQYGVRPLAKRKMVIKLKEIYHYTHRETRVESEGDEDNDVKKPSCSKHEQRSCEEVESRSYDTSSQDGNTQDMESSDSEQNWCEEEQSSDDSEVLSQRTSSNLSKTLMSFLTQDHELYFKILKYTPVSVSDVLETVKGNGIKCSAEQLKNFFDEQCITYSEPRPARVQKRGRRRKIKSSKP